MWSGRRLRNLRHFWPFGRAPAVRSSRWRYGIRPGYRHRLDNDVFDDTGLTDGWQREVYAAAADEAARIGARTVFDVGCGSGFKLVRFFPDTRTVGFELPPTVAFLEQRYPDRDWRHADFDAIVDEPADIVI